MKRFEKETLTTREFVIKRAAEVMSMCVKIRRKEMAIFYMVTTETKTGRKLYLSIWEDQPKWTFGFDMVCFWDSKEMAENFSEKWLKTFIDWRVEVIKVDMKSVN